MSKADQRSLELPRANVEAVHSISEASEVAEAAAVYDAHFSSAASSGTLPFEVARRVLSRLEELDRKFAGQGLSLADLGSADDLAEQMVANLPEPSPWNDIGPFYSTTRVARILGGVSRQAVADRRRRGTILGLRTADGAWVYPTFQFDEHNAVIDGLVAVWKILKDSSTDGWTLASWLRSRLRSLEGRSPVDWLRRGGDRKVLLAVAKDAARRFAQ